VLMLCCETKTNQARSHIIKINIFKHSLQGRCKPSGYLCTSIS
jgi:hypothetical protein